MAGEREIFTLFLFWWIWWWRTEHWWMIWDIGSRGPLWPRNHAQGAPLVLEPKRTAVLKKAMTEKNESWKSGEWYGSTKTRWQQPAGSSGGQSSVDVWEHAKPKGKWIEVSADYRLVKEKKITWTMWHRKRKKRSRSVRHAWKSSYR